MKILITGAWKDGKHNIPLLESLGHETAYLQYEKDQLPCDYQWPDAIICNGLFLYHNIEKFTSLKYIQITSAGFDRIPMDYVKEHNIKICNARGVYSIPMAEFAMAGVLQLMKSMTFFKENQKKHIWEKKRDIQELSGKTVTILGCGSVGQECAKRFSAFGCNVLGVDIIEFECPYFTKMYLLKELNQILPISDIIILTLPLSPDTKHLFNEEKFKLMKDTSILVNISRGGVIDQTALLNYSKKIGGAVLDVFEEEPLCETSSLWDKENIIITPHNSFVSDKNNTRLTNVILNNINAL